MSTRFTFAAAAVAALAAVAGCAKPCQPITEGKDVAELKLVQPGGRLCKDEKNVATIDYPDAKESTLGEMYTTAFSGSGWTTDNPSEGTYFFTKGADALFIVTGKSSKERRVPFAIISYCHDEKGPGCQQRLSDLAKAMGKYKK